MRSPSPSDRHLQRYADIHTNIHTYRQKDVHTYKLRCAYSVAPEETKTRGATGRSEGRQFASRYSPVFQKCVVDVEAKLKADGATALKSLEVAFRICNKSIGDRCVCAFVLLCMDGCMDVCMYVCLYVCMSATNPSVTGACVPLCVCVQRDPFLALSGTGRSGGMRSQKDGSLNPQP